MSAEKTGTMQCDGGGRDARKFGHAGREDGNREQGMNVENLPDSEPEAPEQYRDQGKRVKMRSALAAIRGGLLISPTY